MDGRLSNYEYLVLIDLETVPKSGFQSSGLEPVELSWVVLPNTLNISGSDGLYHKEQHFIMPESASLPSEDYPGLENGVSASTAFRKLDQYLRNALISKNRTFSFVVERVATFQLLRTLVLEHLDSNSSSHWLRAFALLTEFGRSYVSPEPISGVVDMLRLLRLQHAVPFTALESCFAQYAIITRMMRDGFSFSSPELIAGAAQGRISPWGNTTNEVWISGLGADVQPVHLASFLRLGPTMTTDRLLICKSRTGRPTGLAIVQFASHAEAAQTASSWDQSTLDGRPISLSLSLPGEFTLRAVRQAVIHEELAKIQLSTGASSAQALANAAQLAQFQHSAIQNPPNSAHEEARALPPVLPPSHPLSSGNWSGALNAAAMAVDPHTDGAKANSGTTTPTATPQAPSPVLLNRNVLMDMCSRFAESTVVLVRGLAQGTSLNQLAELFASFETAPDSLVMTSLEDGRPSGDAFLAFSTAAQAELAIASLNGKVLNDRQLELSLVN